MKRARTVDEYIENAKHFQEELRTLRSIMLATELEEGIKWGTPCYMVNGKNTIGIAAFKSYVGLWFHQGVFMKDPDGVLLNAQEGTTKGLRQWRFQSNDEINRELVLRYVEEAIKNMKAGKEVKPEKKTLEVPDEMQKVLDSSPALQSAYSNLTPYKQREYADYISSAKRIETRLSRLDKIIPMIKVGAGLHDKYKK